MKLSKLIKTLQSAKNQFGDIPVQLMNELTGDYYPISEVLKLHPDTLNHCTNRAEPVYAIGIVRSRGHATDLVLATNT